MNVAYRKIVTVKQTALKSWQYFYLMLMWSSPFTINGLTSLQTSLWSSPRDSWGNGHKGHETGWWPHCQWVMEPECESWLQILYPSNPWSKLRKNEREKRRNEGKKEEEQRERKRCTHRAMIFILTVTTSHGEPVYTHTRIYWDSQFQLAMPCGLTFSIPLSFIKKC